MYNSILVRLLFTSTKKIHFNKKIYIFLSKGEGVESGGSWEQINMSYKTVAKNWNNAEDIKCLTCFYHTEAI